MSDTDHKKSINIAIKSILDSMYNGKEEIFLITEEIYNENRLIQNNILQIKTAIQNYTKQLEDLKNKEIKSREKLSLVSSDFVNYTQEDIKNSYEESLYLQQTLISKQNEINNILSNLEVFEVKIKDNTQLLTKADNLLSRLEIVSDYISIYDHEKKENNDLFSKWIMFQEHEKNRIARDIHDGPAQTMASLVIKSDIIKKLIEKQSPMQTVYNELEQLKLQIRNVISEIRKIMYDLRPTSLDELGLILSIEGLVSKIKKEHNMDITLEAKENHHIKNNVLNIICFRVIQESLNNILKHSKAKHVKIIININQRHIALTIEDDGIGFDVNKLNSLNSFGLSSLKERVSIAKGELEISSQIQKGTKINVKIPNMEENYA